MGQTKEKIWKNDLLGQINIFINLKKFKRATTGFVKHEKSFLFFVFFVSRFLELNDESAFTVSS